jgi:hypothetical protein
MKTYQRFLVQGAISFLIPPILFAGCSLIGLGIGAISDAQRKGGAGVSGLAELRTFERGTGIVLITIDGSRVDGDFVGIHDLNRQEYDRAYLAAIETLKVRDQLPLPADTISFEYFDAPGKRIRGLFRGVDAGLLFLWRSSGGYSLSGIKNLQGNSGQPLDLFALHVLEQEGRLPGIARGVWVELKRDTVEVPVGEIVRIERDAGGNGKLTGFLVGAAIDALVITVTAVECNKERESQEACNKSSGQNYNCQRQ